jgi:hypothetical protein
MFWCTGWPGTSQPSGVQHSFILCTKNIKRLVLSMGQTREAKYPIEHCPCMICLSRMMTVLGVLPSFHDKSCPPSPRFLQGRTPIRTDIQSFDLCGDPGCYLSNLYLCISIRGKVSHGASDKARGVLHLTEVLCARTEYCTTPFNLFSNAKSGRDNDGQIHVEIKIGG